MACNPSAKQTYTFVDIRDGFTFTKTLDNPGLDKFLEADHWAVLAEDYSGTPIGFID